MRNQVSVSIPVRSNMMNISPDDFVTYERPQEREYMSMKVTELELLTKEYWSSPYDLTMIWYELEHRKKKKKVLSLIAKIENRIIELKRAFKWPIINATPGDGQLDDTNWPKVGMLKHYGYTVGYTGGLPESDRRRILSRVFQEKLAQVDSIDYVKSWGAPDTPERLKKISWSIAAFANNSLRNEGASEKSILDWSSDLDWLHDQYYTGRFHFNWPIIDGHTPRT
ncbi:hypothetical protein CCP1ISM_370001 [Azospirillaceae bacterium]